MKWLARVLGLGASPAAQSEVSREDGDALYALGLAADAGGRGEEALALFSRAVAERPQDAEFRCALGTVLFRSGRARDAAEVFRAGLAIDAGHEQLRFNLASALLVLEDHEGALGELQRLSAQGSGPLRLLPTLGYIQCQLGKMGAGIDSLRRALAVSPNDAGLHSSLLLAMNYSAELDAATIAAEHRRFGDRHEQPVGPAPVDTAWPRRLRVGYVSPDFRAHVVAKFMWPILARHDRERFEVFCYYSNKIVDETTRGLRALAEHWVDCAALPDITLAARVRADRIDILVDLAGHTSKSRLGTFALRPAPVQATYLGYPNTTGLRAIDYRITDALADPLGKADALHVEKLLRLPKTFLCYRPGPEDVAVTPQSGLRAGGVTFGCCNNFQKLSDSFLDVVARVLAATPGSRLLLKAKPLGFRGVAQDLRDRFRERGVDPERLVLRGWASTTESHLAVYSEVDIALDSFPYGGTTTTCEALWMGVPVITLQGDRHAARVGVSILHSVGMDEFIARDADDYVRIAARLAVDLPRFAGLRKGLRQRMLESPLMDEAGFVRDLEHSYLEIWQAKLDAAAPPPDSAQELERLWNRSHETGEHAAAIEALGRAIAADGAVARLHYMLGCTLQDAGRLPEAIETYRKALELEPGLAKAENNLGCVLEAAGDADGAMQCYEAALRAEPGLASALYNRGNMHKQRGAAAQAEEDIGRALRIEPRHADWRCVLGEVCVVQWKLDAATECYRAVLDVDPTDVRAHFGLGNALQMVGRVDEGEACFRRALDLQPDFIAAHSNLLLCLHYLKGNDGPALYSEHAGWAKRHANGLAGATIGGREIDRSPARPLNIGYVSPNFYAHPVATFIEPVLAAQDRGAFRIFIYSTVANPDAVTRRFMTLCDEWRDINAASDDEASRLIRQDRIDILVDLAGHTGGGRPLMFARRPAPVQVTWLGYPDTTGLLEMDYRITDADADPEGEVDNQYSEKLVRLSGGFLCYAPPADSPPVGRSQMIEYKGVTFGSFNNLAKVTPDMIGTWSNILRLLPEARLIMKAHALESEEARKTLRARFASHGITTDRVELLGAELSTRDHLERYGVIDIALDTFPYNGTTTTCEALWMGVPVISLAGRTHASRVGASILTRAGLSDLIASTPQEYLRKAAALAADGRRLRELRAGMRDRMRGCALLDVRGFTRNLESAYRQMWTWRLEAA